MMKRSSQLLMRTFNKNAKTFSSHRFTRTSVSFPLNQSRHFTTSRSLFHGNSSGNESGETVSVHFVDAKGHITVVEGRVGQNILEVAHANGIELEGACECSLACSTCHVYINEDHFAKLPEPVEEEEDMLDLAYGLTPLSRLGCQVILTKELNNIVVTLPKATRNMQVDKPK